MSDGPLTLVDFFPLSERQTIQSVLAEALMADYGIVRKVSGNFVDVEHAVRRVTMPGITAPARVLDPMITRGVELLFPSSSGMVQSWTVAEGDGVLLIGLQNVLPSTEGLTQSQEPPEFWHYSSQTIKAIPLSAPKDAAVQFGETGGKVFLRNQAASLFTILSEFIQGVQGATAGGNPLVDVTGKIGLALSQLQSLMEA